MNALALKRSPHGPKPLVTPDVTALLSCQWIRSKIHALSKTSSRPFSPMEKILASPIQLSPDPHCGSLPKVRPSAEHSAGTQVGVLRVSGFADPWSRPAHLCLRPRRCPLPLRHLFLRPRVPPSVLLLRLRPP